MDAQHGEVVRQGAALGGNWIGPAMEIRGARLRRKRISERIAPQFAKASHAPCDVLSPE